VLVGWSPLTRGPATGPWLVALDFARDALPTNVPKDGLVFSFYQIRFLLVRLLVPVLFVSLSYFKFCISPFFTPDIRKTF